MNTDFATKENDSIVISVAENNTDLENKRQDSKNSWFSRPDWQKRSGIQDVFVRYGQFFS